MTLLIAFGAVTIGVVVMSVASAKYAKTKRDTYTKNASYISEAGISQAIAKLSDDPNTYATTDTQFYSDDNRGKGVFSVKVEAGPNSDSRYITSTGRFYYPKTASTASATQTVRVLVNRNTSKSPYQVFAGYGGMTLDASSKILSANSYIGGKLKFLNTGGQIGDNATPVPRPARVDVANSSCINTSTNRFPYICPYSEEPISILNGNKVYGTVCAYGQATPTTITNSYASTPGASGGSGFSFGCAPIRTVINTIDRSALLTGYATGNALSGANCSNTSATKSPTAGAYVAGNVTISACTAYKPPAIMYIDGNLTISSGSVLQPNDSLGAAGSIIIATGTITVDNSALTSNSTQAPVRLISFNSSDAASSTGCTKTKTCTGFTENSAGWTSKSNSTAVNGITLKSTQGTGEYTAYFSNVTVDGTAAADSYVGSVAGQKVTINANQRLITQGTLGVSDLIQARWVVVDYTRTFVAA